MEYVREKASSDDDEYIQIKGPRQLEVRTVNMRIEIVLPVVQE